VGEGKFKKIYYIRPHVRSIGSDSDVGFLPGTVGEKLFQFRLPVYDSLEGILPKMEIDKLFSEEYPIMECTTPTFLRGRSLKEAIVILEEAQNCDLELFKLVISRLDRDSKLIIIGSSSQIDLRNKGQSALSRIIYKLQGHKGVGLVELTECVRSSYFKDIIDAINTPDDNDEVYNVW